MCFATVEEAIAEIREGRMLIVVDDENRENEGDLTMAAEMVTPEAINFMARYGRGLICLPMTEDRLRDLGIPLMVSENRAKFQTAFCVSIEARKGVTTGISAADRATTIRTAVDPKAEPDDVVQPGHIFPLRAVQGGVLRRAGQTEAAVDLARLAGLRPAGVICEIMNADGSMARVPDLKPFAKQHGLKIVTVEELIRYRMKTERFVQQVATASLPNQFGQWKVSAYQNQLDNEEHVLLSMGEARRDKPILVRVHSRCLTGDVFGSHRCDCGDQLTKAMELISKEGAGLILYLNQEGRGIGLTNKIRAYAIQEDGKDTVEANETLGFKADQREYGVGAQILADVGARKIRLMTNNPNKFIALKGFGLEIVERVPLEVEPAEPARDYMRAKKEKMGHLLDRV